MSFMSEENILKTLSAFNPWWRIGTIKPEFHRKFKRFAFYEAMKHLMHKDLRRAVILTGTRRVGKTIIMYQVIEELLSQGTDPKRILFVSLDHPLLKLCKFNEILECYHRNVYGDQDVFYFFDEIQYAADWDKWLKTLYDMQLSTRIMATGSASPVLVKKSTESGAGRWIIVQVPTLSFYEYCELLNVENQPVLAADVRPTGLASLDKQEWTELMLKLSSLQKYFNRYMQVGGFPELAISKDDYMAQNIMREDVVDKVLKRDLPALYNIRNSTELEKIFLYLCYCSSDIISIDAIAKELEGVSRPTVEDYIGYLESANLIYRSFPVRMAGKKVLKARPKVYIADAAIRNAVLMQEDLLTNTEEMGIMAETAVYKHVASFYYQKATNVGYYRDGTKGKEIDIVVDYPRGRILIEVKYREQASIGGKDAVFTESDAADAAIVITKREDDYGVQPTQGNKPLLRIPAFAFLYLLGNAEKHGYKGFKN